MADGLRSHKKIISTIADNVKFQFNQMQQVFCKKHFDEFIKFDYLNDRFDVFLGKYFLERKICRACVRQVSFFPMSRVLLNVVFLSIKS